MHVRQAAVTEVPSWDLQSSTYLSLSPAVSQPLGDPESWKTQAAVLAN